MLTFLIVSLILMDLTLLLAVVSLFKKQKEQRYERFVEFIGQERKLLSNMREGIKEELESHATHNREILSKIQEYALMTEQESLNLEKRFVELTNQCHIQIDTYIKDSLDQFSEKKNSFHILLKKLENEKITLAKQLQRAEKLSSYLAKKISFDDLVDDLLEKKLDEARLLMTQGKTLPQISKLTGLSTEELRLLEA